MITFENSAGRVGQAVALHVEGDRATFRHCRLLGNQDRLFLAIENSRQYYQDCYIEGTTDFIFGASTAVFERCTIHSKADSYIIAASTTPRQSFELVFLNCRLTAAPEAKRCTWGGPGGRMLALYLSTLLWAHIFAPKDGITGAPVSLIYGALSGLGSKLGAIGAGPKLGDDVVFGRGAIRERGAVGKGSEKAVSVSSRNRETFIGQKKEAGRKEAGSAGEYRFVVTCF